MRTKGARTGPPQVDWVERILGGMAAGVSLPRAILGAADSGNPLARRMALRILRGFSTKGLEAEGSGSAALLLSLLGRASDASSVRARREALRALGEIYENQRLSEVAKAKQRALALRSFIVASLLAGTMPFFIHLVPLILQLYSPEFGKPSSGVEWWLPYLGFALCMHSSYFLSQFHGFSKRYVMMAVTALIYLIVDPMASSALNVGR